MRAVECTVVADCAHVHAENDGELVRAVRRHTAQVHPDIAFSEAAAESLVEDKGYDDRKHRKKGGWAEFVGSTGGGIEG